MRAKVIILTILCLGPFILPAQYYWDYGIKAGASSYLGEFGGKDKPRRDFVMDMKLSQTRWVGSAFARYKVKRNIAAALSLTYIRLQGADNLSSYPNRYARNLSFRNDMFELALRAEYYFYTIYDVGGKGRYEVDFRSYIFGGVGMFYNNPKTNYGGSWVKLQPLQTEGVKYSRFQPTFPIGVGIYYTYKKKHRFGWEFAWATTFTDYIDDASGTYADPKTLSAEAAAVANRTDELSDSDPIASQLNGENGSFKNFYGVEGAIRGDPTHKDSYLYTNLSYSHVIRGKGSLYRTKYNFVYGNKRRSRRTRAKF